MKTAKELHDVFDKAFFVYLVSDYEECGANLRAAWQAVADAANEDSDTAETINAECVIQTVMEFTE